MNSEPATPKPAIRPHAAAAAALCVAATLAGCGQPAPVSKDAFLYAQALYGVASRQQADRLDAVSGQIESALAAGDLTDTEAERLQAIVQQARDGEWKTAAAAARRIMDAQTRAP
ncbi:MAG: hypothetical protein AAF790_10920 [Planctomycetota bacterium]